MAADSDTNGLSIEDAALTLNSGTIRELAGTEDAALALGDSAISNSGAHKVDGANAPRAAAIVATNPAELEEASLDGATLTVELANTTYSSGVVAANFTLATGVPGLTVGSVSPVSSGDTQATLTLRYNDTDFDSERSLALFVAASAHMGSAALATPPVPVAATFELRLSRTTLALNERPGANTGTYTVRLDEPPTDPVALTVASTAASVAVDVDGGTAGDQSVLTFTAADWATPRTVTVRALPDDDASAESVAIVHSVPVFGNVGEVTVTVADDDRGEVLVDVAPSTPRRDPGPLVLYEARGHRLNVARYAVSLSAQPTANVTVAITIDEAELVSLDATALTFTPQNWATARTLTAKALDDLDPLGESASISHVANGGGYNSVNGLLRVGLVDDDGVFVDYDVDNDGLIEISTLAQLDAMRWDLRGAGVPSAANRILLPRRLSAPLGGHGVSGRKCRGGLFGLRAGGGPGLRHRWRRRHLVRQPAGQRLRRRLPQRRCRLVADRRRQQPVPCGLRRQRPRDPQPVRELDGSLSGAVRAWWTAPRRSRGWAWRTPAWSPPATGTACSPAASWARRGWRRSGRRARWTGPAASAACWGWRGGTRRWSPATRPRR